MIIQIIGLPGSGKTMLAKRLADKAIEKGSTDNISVIVVYFK
mgnify:CR=1 FL=1